MTHPAASVRPVIVNSACTPPSVVCVTLPLETAKGKRASRTGPSAVTKNGIALDAPFAVPAAICGFGPMLGYSEVEGLVPPVAGCAWQLLQLFELNVGPRPFETASTC